MKNVSQLLKQHNSKVKYTAYCANVAYQPCDLSAEYKVEASQAFLEYMSAFSNAN